MRWRQPVENTVNAISQGISLFDGVEFDLRLTSDGGIILHHDREVKVSKEEIAGLPSKYVEGNTLDELKQLGFDDFDELMANSNFIERIAEQACVACIELKVPHPSSGIGGGWLFSSAKHMAKLLAAVDERLKEHSIPNENTVFYSFHRRMWKIARIAESTRHVSTLRPIVPPYGTPLVQKIRSVPQFITMPLGRLVRWHKWDRSPMIPCALEYLVPPTNRYTIGLPVGLHGKRLQRLRRLSGGLPLYVWPGDIELESRLVDCGLTPITDVADPELSTLPCGTARWRQPATQPLNDEWQALLAQASPNEHEEILLKAREEVAPWHELSGSERREHLSSWRKRFAWKRELSELEASSSAQTLPWETVRIIGHRGCGKSPE